MYVIPAAVFQKKASYRRRQCRH